MPIKHILFDCDGTLIDSERFFLNRLEELLAEHDIEIPQNEKNKLYGSSYENIVTIITELSDTICINTLEQKFSHNLDNDLHSNLEAINGAHNLLQDIPDYCKSIVSNGTRSMVLKCLNIADLKKYFPDEKIFTIEKVKRPKPYTDLYQHSVESIGAKMDQCLTIEDSIPGAQASINCGIKTILYLNPNYTAEYRNYVINQIENLNITGIIDNLEQIKKFL